MFSFGNVPFSPSAYGFKHKFSLELEVDSICALMLCMELLKNLIIKHTS